MEFTCSSLLSARYYHCRQRMLLCNLRVRLCTTTACVTAAVVTDNSGTVRTLLLQCGANTRYSSTIVIGATIATAVASCEHAWVRRSSSAQRAPRQTCMRVVQGAGGAEFGIVLTVQQSTVSTLTWRARDRVLMSTSLDGQVYMWEVVGGRKLQESYFLRAGITAATASKDFSR
eukprot:4960-Heterococcus_DN1.PRE.1